MSPRRAAARARRSLNLFGRSAEQALDLFRHGDRTIIMCPSAGLRLGNFLYLWLQAHRRSADGLPTAVRSSSGMAPWLDRLPEMAALTVDADAIRFEDRREWHSEFLYQRFGTDFSRDDVRAFVQQTLAPHVPLNSSYDLVVNIRRGDYYTEFREKYAFDQVGYVRQALTRFRGANRILVVSDDAEWCLTYLEPVLREVTTRVEYAQPDPWQNFAAVAGASHVIGTNSTFSYWAAYVADAIHADAQIVMPRFHARAPGPVSAYQLDPQWTAVDGFH